MWCDFGPIVGVFHFIVVFAFFVGVAATLLFNGSFLWAVASFVGGVFVAGGVGYLTEKSP